MCLTLTTFCHTAWEETGAIPDCEDLKIHTPAATSQSPTNSRPTRVLRKKRVKTTHDIRPVDLLEEDSDTNPGPNALPEVSQSEKQNSPSTGNNRGKSSTENAGSTQKTNDKSSSAPPSKPAQTQGPLPSNHPLPDSEANMTIPSSNDSNEPNAHHNPPNSSSATTGQTSDKPPPNPSNQPDPSNQAAPSGPSNPNTSVQTDQQPSSGNNNQTQPAPGPQPAPQQFNTSHSSTPTNTQLTIILNIDAQIEVITMQQNENRGRANWQQYQTYWECLSSHIKLWAESLQHVSPIKPDFHFQRASCSYAEWIKTISSLGESRSTHKSFVILFLLTHFFTPHQPLSF